MNEEKRTDRKLETNEKWIIIATLAIFAISFLLSALDSPKILNNTVVYSSSSDTLGSDTLGSDTTSSDTTMVESEISDYPRISSSDLEMLLDAKNSQSETKISSKININTADLTQLQTLNGIGEVKAKAIIEYRNTYGRFNSVEELKNVSGIGDKTFEKIKDLITV